ncbi:Carboxypeptidase C (cathepsin A) [Lecanosticta acicola]|uniref:Carboxypeptidase C (Cathepsin A) n=1 Tax=Lecanosticta acicola TaxID=111012 RepID=A0AAI8YPN9_9PEZI|nr:Carboxypeptidase C (cathepsin A) [Lecanosticta acicola]
MLLCRVFYLTALGPFALAQFPPKPKDVTVVNSSLIEDAGISYKENSLCETTPGVRSWAGYVHLPPGILSNLGVKNQTWPINTFFWFFQARDKRPRDAPTMIWLNGGPGSSSSGNPLGIGSGTCTVNPDANSTALNEWSWNREVNMLYVDQPVEVGLSYDSFQNISYNLINGNVTILNETTGIPGQNTTLQVGTWASTDTYKTSPGSVNGAYAMWYFAQVFFNDFPEHRPRDTRIGVFGVSYGGKYAPAIASFFEEQNEKIQTGKWKLPGKELNVDTLIVDSGCVDLPASWFSYPVMAVNNTYGIKAVNESTVHKMLHDLNRPGGCLDQAYHCGNLSLKYDPLNVGINETVNHVCFKAGKFCDDEVQGPFDRSNRSFYDITVPDSLSRVPPFQFAYMQRPWVQEALGMRINWSNYSPWASEAVRREGDFARPGWPDKMAYLLERGKKVAFMYGDKDYICNWFGGEAVSLAIKYTDTAKFHAAGYTGIHTNESYIGGQVRQYGNLSFSRLYQAGHGVAGQQPETAYKIINRVFYDRDVATGTRSTAKGEFTTEGPSSSAGIKNEVIPVEVLQVCYLLDVNETCSDDQQKMIQNGTVEIKEYMVVDKNSTQRYPQIVGSGMGMG